MKSMHIRKKDILFSLIYLMLFLVISQRGTIKYVVLAAGIVAAFLLRNKQKPQYYIILVHAAIYSVIGLLLGLIERNLTFNSLKQLLIYLCSGLFSIGIFSVYGQKETKRLLDIQLLSLCVAYLILYGKYFTIRTPYFESNLYAYIFGAYALVYFWQRRYYLMALAIIFMLFDHKRIADAAFVASLVVLVLIRGVRKDKTRKAINFVFKIAVIAGPLLWVYGCSSGLLADLLARLHINTMGRLDGTGAWNIAKEYYSFSPAYTGKGIGWVLEWLEHANIMAFSNLHNDFLVGYIELGFIGFAIWICSFLLLPRRTEKEDLSISNLVFLLLGFMFINLLTDNIYIYVTFLIPYYTMLLSIMFGEDREVFSKNRIYWISRS